MTNHPNRGRRTAASNPLPLDVLRARQNAGHTQKQAAETVFCTVATWERWEYGTRRMHPAFYKLYKILTEQDES